jgi:hypothetical protein
MRCRLIWPRPIPGWSSLVAEELWGLRSTLCRLRESHFCGSSGYFATAWESEDQFFATVFLGSGLLFVASLFGVAAVLRALVETLAVDRMDSATFYFGHRMSDALFNVFAIKMAGVFIISTCTIGLRTAIIPRWVAIIGYACALVLLLVIANWKWITFVFPLWMLLVSTYILFAEFRPRSANTA